MIGFNGTYLSRISHGNMRITAATICGQWVIDGNSWLLNATQQAIIAEFGATEGKAVILRTTDYLHQVALTDTQRAQQLSVFINENPMLAPFLIEHRDLANILIKHPTMNFETPLFPSSTVSDSQRMWLYRKGRSANWYQINDIISQNDWEWYKGGFGVAPYAGLAGTDIRKNGSPFCIVKFFIPQDMPIGYQYTRAD